MPSLQEVIVWLIIGALAGAAASAFTRRALTLGEMIIAGLLGAFVGAFILNMFDVNLGWLNEPISFSLADLLTAFIGAAILISFAELVIGYRRR